MKIGMMSHPCGKYEQITLSHLLEVLIRLSHLNLRHSVLNQRKIMQVRHWYGNNSMYESNLIIKFGKNLFNFVCRVVAAFVSV